ncbi:hypothetical protein ACFFX0_32950 [Citricoccus parietis]|uniref:MFS transporter n=1 Tax=Citricoccus parietis TaxID=592307 RepID=A0ABV5G9T0_9MICC
MDRHPRCGQGALTALALTMITLRSTTPHMAIRVSGMMQGLGYGLGSAGTFITVRSSPPRGPSGRRPGCSPPLGSVPRPSAGWRAGTGRSRGSQPASCLSGLVFSRVRVGAGRADTHRNSTQNPEWPAWDRIGLSWENGRDG